MAAMPPPVADERQDLREFLRFSTDAFLAVAFGLTDEQARATPTVSALSIGALIKHVTGCQHGWMQRVAAAPEMPPRDERPMEEIRRSTTDEFVMRDDETLADVLAKFDEQNAETLRVFVETVDLDAAVPVPQRRAVVPEGRRQPGRCAGCLFHMIEELARHAGQADIIRETIDGATMYELLAGLEDWPRPTSSSRGLRTPVGETRHGRVRVQT